MFRIGSHISSAKGWLAMAKEAARIGANTFQFFTRNPRGSKAKALDLQDVEALREYAGKHDIRPFLAHASYTINMSASEKKLRVFAGETIADDLARLEHLPGSMYNIHPGSHHENGKRAISLVAETLNAVLQPGRGAVVLLEAMSGRGGEIGSSFEELRAIMDAVKNAERLGVCLDTCHLYGAGYDIVDKLDDVLENFDRVVGLEFLRAVHLNDSKNPLGSRKDRHAKIGEGEIGIKAFGRIINHPALRDLPFYLETPNDADGYAQEIARLKKLYKS